MSSSSMTAQRRYNSFMSIIHDALKKVQQNLDKKTDEDIIVIPSQNPVTPQPSKSLTGRETPWLMISLALIIIATSVFFIYKQLNTLSPSFRTWMHTASKKTEQIIPAVIKASPKAAAVTPMAQVIVAPAAVKTDQPAAAVTTTMPPQTLNVLGVMAQGNQNLVLIDDKVYQEGDTVDGVTIVKITINEIQVLNNGKAETIPVKK